MITKKINNNYFSFLADASDVSMGDILVENVLNRVSLKLNKNNIVSPLFITMHYITAVLVTCYNLFPFYVIYSIRLDPEVCVGMKLTRESRYSLTW